MFVASAHQMYILSLYDLFITIFFVLSLFWTIQIWTFNNKLEKIIITFWAKSLSAEYWLVSQVDKWGKKKQLSSPLILKILVSDDEVNDVKSIMSKKRIILWWAGLICALIKIIWSIIGTFCKRLLTCSQNGSADKIGR